jgi:hypothetical protein
MISIRIIFQNPDRLLLAGRNICQHTNVDNLNLSESSGFIRKFFRLYDDYSIPPLTQTLDDIKAQFHIHVFLKTVNNSAIIGSVRAYGVYFIGTHYSRKSVQFFLWDQRFGRGSFYAGRVRWGGGYRQSLVLRALRSAGDKGVGRAIHEAGNKKDDE